MRWLPLLVLLCAPRAARAEATPITIVPLLPSPDEAGVLPRVTAELAQRCPSARQVPFAAVAQLVPRLEQLPPGAPVPALPPADLHAAFLRGEEWMGSAVRLQQMALQLEQDPAALLSQPERRARLRDAYLYAARALLQAGDAATARAVLTRAAVRLPDLPVVTTAQWGPALQAAAEQARQRLPEATIELLAQGPSGWALHLDEQPLGALPLRARLRPGPHAVVAVGPDGTRASWVLDAPGRSAAPLRLVVDERLRALCAVQGVAGWCHSAPPEGLSALVRLLGGAVIAVEQSGGRLRAFRLPAQGQGPAPAPVTVPLGDESVTQLAQRLCAPPPPTPAPGPAVATLAARRAPPHRRAAWPGLVLLGAGLAVGLATLPLFVYQGRCVDPDCFQAYDFHGLPPGLLSAGAALTIGGAIWLGFALR